MQARYTSLADKLAKAVPKFSCPSCGEGVSAVTKGTPDLKSSEDLYRRWRRCLFCGYRYTTKEILE